MNGRKMENGKPKPEFGISRIKEGGLMRKKP
jgi:hypothetical protein